jgi:hypothetical protein
MAVQNLTFVTKERGRVFCNSMNAVKLTKSKSSKFNFKTRADEQKGWNG